MMLPGNDREEKIIYALLAFVIAFYVVLIAYAVAMAVLYG